MTSSRSFDRALSEALAPAGWPAEALSVTPGTARVVVAGRVAAGCLAELSASLHPREAAAVAVAAAALLRRTLPWPREVPFWSKVALGTHFVAVSGRGGAGSAQSITGWSSPLPRRDGSVAASAEPPGHVVSDGVAAWGRQCRGVAAIGSALEAAGRAGDAASLARAASLATWRTLVTGWTAPATASWKQSRGAELAVDPSRPAERPLAEWSAFADVSRSVTVPKDVDAAAEAELVGLLLRLAPEHGDATAGAGRLGRGLADAAGAGSAPSAGRAVSDAVVRALGRALGPGAVSAVESGGRWTQASPLLRLLDGTDAFGGSAVPGGAEAGAGAAEGATLHPLALASALALSLAAALPPGGVEGGAAWSASWAVQAGRRLRLASGSARMCGAALAAVSGAACRLTMAVCGWDAGAAAAGRADPMLAAGAAAAGAAAASSARRSVVLLDAEAVVAALQAGGPALRGSSSAAGPAMAPVLFGGAAGGAAGARRTGEGVSGAELMRRRRRKLVAVLASGSAASTGASVVGCRALAAAMDVVACSEAGTSVLSAAGDVAASALLASSTARPHLARRGFALLRRLHSLALVPERSAVRSSAIALRSAVGAAASSGSGSASALRWLCSPTPVAGGVGGVALAPSVLTLALGAAPEAGEEPARLFGPPRRAVLSAAVASGPAAAAACSAVLASALPLYPARAAAAGASLSSCPGASQGAQGGSADEESALLALVMTEEGAAVGAGAVDAGDEGARAWVAGLLGSGVGEAAARRMGSLCDGRPERAGAAIGAAWAMRGRGVTPRGAVAAAAEASRLHGCRDDVIRSIGGAPHGGDASPVPAAAASAWRGPMDAFVEASGGSAAGRGADAAGDDDEAEADASALLVLSELCRWEVLSGMESLGCAVDATLPDAASHSPSAGVRPPLYAVGAAPEGGAGEAADGVATLLLRHARPAAGDGVRAAVAGAVLSLAGDVPAELRGRWQSAAAGLAASLPRQRRIVGACMALAAAPGAPRRAVCALVHACGGLGHGSAATPELRLLPCVATALGPMGATCDGSAEAAVAAGLATFWSGLAVSVPPAGLRAASSWMCGMVRAAGGASWSGLLHHIAASESAAAVTVKTW